MSAATVLLASGPVAPELQHDYPIQMYEIACAILTCGAWLVRIAA
jgi:hypothetical protein